MLHRLRTGCVAISFALAANLFAVSANAAITSKEQTAKELALALKINQPYLNDTSPRESTLEGQPSLETDQFRYILMGGDDKGNRELIEMHRTFAQNLPANMILVLVTESYSADSVQSKFAKWLPKERFIVASGNNIGDATWGRDAYPYPVYKDSLGNVELIAHQYYRAFSGQKLISDAVNSKNTNNQGFVYVGGNLQATEHGDCFIVDSTRTFKLPDAQFLNVFRCKTVTRFPHVVGIGDVDEVIKILPNNVVLTNQKSYQAKLENLGYRVVLLPEVKNSYRTYANSVILNDTVFMPTFGNALDLEAQKVYESMGYKVIGIRTNSLSDNLHGSLHCLTMTYPDMDLHSLLGSVGLSTSPQN